RVGRLPQRRPQPKRYVLADCLRAFDEHELAVLDHQVAVRSDLQVHHSTFTFVALICSLSVSHTPIAAVNAAPAFSPDGSAGVPTAAAPAARNPSTAAITASAIATDSTD